MPSSVTKPVIAVDIDDVLAAENEGIREFTNRKYGLNHTPEDYLIEGDFKGYWEKIWQLNETEAKKHYEDFLKSSTKAHLQVVDGAVSALSKLKSRYDLVVISSRFGPAINISKPWIEEHFPDTFRAVELIAQRNEATTKADVCKELGVSYLIDDDPAACNLVAREGIKVLLFGDYGWSRNVGLHQGIVRVKNWQEVLEYFENESR